MTQHIPATGDSVFWLRAARALMLIFLSLVPVFFWRGAVEPFEACKANLLHLVALLVAGCLVCAGTPFRDRFWREPIGLAMLLTLLSAVVSTVFSISPRTSFWGGWESHQGLLTVASLFVLFLASRSLFDARDLPSMILALAVGVVVCATYALIQTVQSDPFGWIEVSNYGSYLRPIGTLGHPNYLAGFLIMALPLLCWWFASTRRLAVLIAILICGAVVVAALSRAAWLAAALLLGLPLFRLPWRKQLYIGAGAAALFAAVVVLACSNLLGPIGTRIRNVADSSSRTAMWKVSGQIFLDAPLTGSGVDTFQLAFTRHRSTEYWKHEFGYTPTHAHNDPLDLLATQGGIGLGCYLLLAGAIVLAAFRTWQRRPADRGLILALGGVSLAYFVQNWFGFPVVATTSLHAISLGCLSRLSDSRIQDGHRVSESSWPIAIGLALACLVLPLNFLFEPWTPASFWTPAVLALLGGFLVLSSCDRSKRESRSVSTGFSFRVPLWQGTVVLGVLVLAWIVAVRPFVAWCLIREGQDLLDVDTLLALRNYERAVASAPWLDTPLARLAAARHRAACTYGYPDQLDRAVVAAEWARDRVPANPTHHAALGRIVLDLVRRGQARPDLVWRSFDESLKRDPENTLLLLDAARAAIILGDLERARTYLFRGKQLDPKLAPLIAEEGVLAIAEGRLPEAADRLRGTLEEKWYDQSEAHGRAHGLLAAVCYQLEDYDEALEQADRALRTHPGPNTYEIATRWVRAAALERLGGEWEAREEARYILLRRPDHAEALELLKRTE